MRLPEQSELEGPNHCIDIVVRIIGNPRWRPINVYNGKDAEIERLRARSTKFEQLLSEALRHGWLDESKTSPSWLQEALAAVEVLIRNWERLRGWLNEDREPGSLPVTSKRTS